MIVGIIRQKPVLTHASIIFGGMLASVNSVKKHNVARVEAYLRAKFHLYPCNRLATIYQHHRQDRQDDCPLA